MIANKNHDIMTKNFYIVIFMSLNYNNLWKLLIDKEMKRTDLITLAGISSNVLARMSKNKPVSLESLEKICISLDCEIQDILTIKKGE